LILKMRNLKKVSVAHKCDKVGHYGIFGENTGESAHEGLEETGPCRGEDK